jgi:hypothetical protein
VINFNAANKQFAEERVLNNFNSGAQVCWAVEDGTCTLSPKAQLIIAFCTNDICHIVAGNKFGGKDFC